MKVNFGKIKVMVFESSESTTECDILIEGGKVERLKEWLDLGGLFTKDDERDRDIERRVNAGNKVNGVLLAIMDSKSALRQTCLAIYKGVLIPTLMKAGYGGRKMKVGSMQWRCDRCV
ncbi:hypothetical protein EVAR_12064_1 [Eumeta japonica]|uniref:Uncharacterized protein n=1 Tax=Eumeta variegata TaxID=151549 RepID=A0A4C1U4Z8_EUMVA|nr:hypothetical protein EVAR_12064_1 [Eumeta japonica]